MLGEWKGGEFVTGHRMNGQLEKSRWFGKTFNSPDDVQPLVCLDDDGNRFSNVKMGKGEASLWLEEFRGEVTATMVYDGQPVHDHFKQVDDHTVMGIMNGKGVIDVRTASAATSTSTWNASDSGPRSGRIAAREGDQSVEGAGFGRRLDRVCRTLRSARRWGVMIFSASPNT